MANQTKKNTKSKSLFSRAQNVLVGGVNSPVRAFGGVGGFPRFIQKARGPYLTDVDGQRYVDFVGSWGPMLLGHNHPAVKRAISGALAKGTSFGAPTENEINLAQLVRSAYPTMEKIRFVNSGTEATMSALRLARAVTGRDRILKFEGGYHGHSDSLLVSAGSGATTFGVPSSAGVPDSIARGTWVLPYNDQDALENLFQTQGPNIAAVIVEPVAGNMGVVSPSPFFLQELRKLTKRHNTLLIFDEVMTGFRLGWGGAQSRFKVEPDITCLGKIIGGGLPVGAFGGPSEYMDQLAPLGPVYQAGTLSGNPLAMAAGLATLKAIKKMNPYAKLEKLSREWVGLIHDAASRAGVPIRINAVGSMFTVFFTPNPINSYFDAKMADTKKYAAFFHGLLNRGVYFPPSQFEAGFLSVMHSSRVLREAATALPGAFKEVAKIK